MTVNHRHTITTVYEAEQAEIFSVTEPADSNADWLSDAFAGQFTFGRNRVYTANRRTIRTVTELRSTTVLCDRTG